MSTVEFSWPLPDDGGSPLTGHRVIRRRYTDGAPGPWSTVFNSSVPTSTGGVDTTPEAGVLYGYSHAARNARGEAAFSAEKTIQIPAEGPVVPGQPTGVTVSNIAAGSATVTWQAAANATQYLVQFKLATASTWTTSGSTTSLSRNLTGLSASSNYQVRVTAFNGDTAGPASADVPFTTLAAPAPSAGAYLIASKAHLDSRPTSGEAWDYMKSRADAPKIANVVVDTYDHGPAEQVAAAGYLYYKTGQQAYKDKVVALCREIIGTEEATEPLSEGGENMLLATTRTLPAYVIAADLVGMDKNLTGTRSGQASVSWSSWLLNRILYRPTTDPIGTHGRWRTPLNCMTNAPANWGPQSLQTCVAISLYLDETQERAKIVRVARGLMGDSNPATGHPAYPIGSHPPDHNTNSSKGFQSVAGQAAWASSPYSSSAPAYLPINPANSPDARLNGSHVADATRGGASSASDWLGRSYQDSGVSYGYEFMTGFMLAIGMLHNAGYDILGVNDNAIKRWGEFMVRQGWWPSAYEGRFVCGPWINHHYGTALAVGSSTYTDYNASQFWHWLYG